MAGLLAENARAYREIEGGRTRPPIKRVRAFQKVVADIGTRRFYAIGRGRA